jgi:SAM-dependent methyltransferase
MGVGASARGDGTPPGAAPPRYHASRPPQLRDPGVRHPHRHHIRSLPDGLRALVDDLNVPTGGRILDYGCAEMPYRDFFAPDVEYVGADLPGNPNASVTLEPDGSLPVPDSSFDVVLSTQVLEHVQDPALYLSECFRVLRPGGRMLLSTHGIFFYHPDPVDLWRWTCEGLRRVAQDAGFEVVRFEGIIGLAATGLQLFQDAIAFRLPRSLVPWLALIMQPIVALAEWIDSAQSRRYNAQVFALVAQRP